MDRRTFLTVSGACVGAVTAGCLGDSGDGDSDDESSDGGADEATDDESSETTDGGSDETTGGENAGETDGGSDATADDLGGEGTGSEGGIAANGLSPGDADISIERTELRVSDEGAPSALVEVVNDGDGASGPVTVTAEWIDDQGEVAGDDDVDVETIRAGETWYAHPFGVVRADVAVEETTASVETDPLPPEAPPNVQVNDHEITDRNAGTVTVEGEVSNEGRDAVDVTAIVRTFDEGGRLLGDAPTHERDLAPGETRSVTIRAPATHPDASVADYEILIDEFP